MDERELLFFFVDLPPCWPRCGLCFLPMTAADVPRSCDLLFAVKSEGRDPSIKQMLMSWLGLEQRTEVDSDQC
jgi:hypothetical protein